MALPATAYAIPATVQPARIAVQPIRSTSAARQKEAQIEHDAETERRRTVDQVNRVLDRCEARAELMTAGIAALQKRKKFILARYARIEARAVRELDAAGLKKVVGVTTTLEQRAAGVPALIVDDQALIPKQYIKTETVESVLNAALKAALVANERIDGAHLAYAISLIRT